MKILRKEFLAMSCYEFVLYSTLNSMNFNFFFCDKLLSSKSTFPEVPNCFKLYALLFRVAIDFFVMEMMIHCINADTVSRKNSQPSRPYSLLTLPHGLIFVSNTYSCFFLYSRVFPVQSTAINALKNCV